MAHIYAVAGMAGVAHALSHVHDYGVDGQFDPVVIRDKRRVVAGHPIAFQAKATTNWQTVGNSIVYDLEAKTYDDIVTRTAAEITMMLVLLCLPKDQAEWHRVTPTATIMPHCCYWHIPRGDRCGNKATTRIFIPAANVLTAESLRELMAAEKLRREL